jgi:Carboxypeptidase regulatory-like domain
VMGNEPLTRRWTLPASDLVSERERANLRVSFAWTGAPTDRPDVWARAGRERPVLGETRGDHTSFELPLGEYEVFVSGIPSSSQRVLLRQPGQLVELQLVLPGSASLSGQVLDASGGPVPEAWVTATTSDREFGKPVAPPVLTDEAGYFTVSGLHTGRYDVSASSAAGDARVRQVAAGARDVPLRIEEQGAIDGMTVSANGERPESFLLYYQRSEDGQRRSQLGYRGQWTLAWLRPGTYELCAESALGSGTSRVQLDSGGRVNVTLRVSAANPGCHQGK